MGIVGDVIGNGGDLRFNRGKACKLEIMNFGIFDDHLRQAAFLEMAKGVATGINQRAIVLDQAFKGFPGEVQAIELGVFPLQPGDNSQGLGVVIEAAIGGHELVEFAFAGMAKGRVAKIVGQGQGFGQILVKAEDAGNGPCDLGNFNGMGEPGAVVVALVIHENLGFMLQAPEGGGVDNAVPVTLESRARRAFGFREQPVPCSPRAWPHSLPCDVSFYRTIDNSVPKTDINAHGKHCKHYRPRRKPDL